MIDATPHQGVSLGGRRKRRDHAQAIGRSRGGRRTNIHALTDETGRPRVLLLTPGNVNDGTMAQALIAGAGGSIRGRSLTGPTTPIPCATSSPRPTPRSSSRPPRAADHRSPTTARPTDTATASSACSAASRTSEGSQPDTTRSLATTPPPSISRQSSLSGSIESQP